MSYRVKGLQWSISPSLKGFKLTANDCFGGVFARLDLAKGEDERSIRVVRFKEEMQGQYKKAILGALEPKGSFAEGDVVYKPKGSWWQGTVVGFYSTSQTPEGYAVQLDNVKDGPVQIYPVQALELLIRGSK
jgi:hypothetical protein